MHSCQRIRDFLMKPRSCKPVLLFVTQRHRLQKARGVCSENMQLFAAPQTWSRGWSTPAPRVSKYACVCTCARTHVCRAWVAHQTGSERKRSAAGT